MSENTGMSKLPRRRVVRRAVMALAGCVLLLVWYVGSWTILPHALDAGIISFDTWFSLEDTAYAPVHMYREAAWPGASLLDDLWYEVDTLLRDDGGEATDVPTAAGATFK